MVFHITQNRTRPKLLFQATNSDGKPVDLSTCTSVKFTLIYQDRSKTIYRKDLSASLSQAGTCYPPSEGWLEYEFKAEDTALSGFFYGRFDTYKDSYFAAYPNQFEKLEVYIEPEGKITA